MPLLTERQHMQLWCPEARVVIVDFGGPKLISPESPGIPAKMVESSPTLNRMDFGAEAGLKVPQSCLCFGSKCGAWQWAAFFQGRDGKHYTDADRQGGRIKPDAMPLEQMGYCGKAAPLELVLPVKPSKLQPPPVAANDGAGAPPPESTNPPGETIQ